MYSSSFNEGAAMEDWQGIPGMSTVQALAAANANGNPVIKITASNWFNAWNGNCLINQTCAAYATLLSQPAGKCLPNEVINLIGSEIGNGKTVITPVQFLNVDGQNHYAFIVLSPDGQHAFYFDNSLGATTFTTFVGGGRTGFLGVASRTDCHGGIRTGRHGYSAGIGP